MVKKVNEFGISWIVNLNTMGEGSSEFFFTPALEKYHDVYTVCPTKHDSMQDDLNVVLIFDIICCIYLST